MSLQGPKRVHIAPQGYEKDRIYGPAIEYNADEVVLLVHRNKTDKSEECRREIVGALTSSSIEYSIRECDIFGFDSTLWAMAELIQEYAEDKVYVNVSTGSKITAIGGIFACMATGATPYYAQMDEYSGETISEGYVGSINLPAYPIGLPNEQYLKILQYIDEQETISKKDLISYTRDFPLLSKYSRQDERNEYEPLNVEIIEPLRRRGFIRQRKLGTERQLELTEDGEDMLKLAGYLVD